MAFSLSLSLKCITIHLGCEGYLMRMAKRRVFKPENGETSTSTKAHENNEHHEQDHKKQKLQQEDSSNGVDSKKQPDGKAKKNPPASAALAPASNKKEDKKEKEKPKKEEKPKEKPKEEKKEEKEEHPTHLSSAASGSVASADDKITLDNQISHPTRRHYSVLSLDMMKDKSFRNLKSLYLNSVIWDDALLSSLEKRISEMTELETLVIKEHKIGLKLTINNKRLKNFGLFARELRELNLMTPNLESITIVHTLHCGTAFFADLLEKCPKLKYVNLWENFGIIQFTANLPELETLILSRTSATKLSFQHILENFPTLKTLICSNVDVTGRTMQAWKKKYDVDVIIDATRDFFFVFIERLADFDNLELFHEEQKY